MCGILGFWNFDGQLLDFPLLKRLNEQIRHRGPDDEGYYLWQDTAGDVNRGSLGLAHSRLAVLDLSSSGRQPMSDESGMIWTVFNGEIFNFRELRKELEGKGYQFRSQTDTEVLIYAYQEWGIDAVSRLNGMFAIALWDTRTRKLYLVRDRLGVKPLYYYLDTNRLIFASELKPIMCFPGIDKAISEEGLAKYLMWQYVPSPATILRNTYKVRPGHVLTITAEGIATDATYWDASWHVGQATKEKTDEEYLEELDALITSSIRYRMISDVPLGAFLSGGVDSSLIVAIMRQFSRHPVKTFAIGFDSPRFNEAPHARAVSEKLGTEHYELFIGPEDVARSFPKVADYYDEPFADTAVIPTMLLSELARNQVTVSLSGDGGDELFGGYDRYAVMSRLERLYKAPAALRKSVQALHRIPVSAFKRRSFWLEPYPTLMHAYCRLMRVFSPSAVEELTGIRSPETGSGTLPNLSHMPCRSALQSVSLLDTKTYLADCMMTKLDRASMSVGLEGRTPYLDYRLVEFALRLPDLHKVRKGRRKHILKALLERYLPASVVNRPKQGFNMPLAQWLRRELSEVTNDYLSPSFLKHQNLFRPEAVSRLLGEHFNGSHDHYPQLYSLITFQLWHQRYATHLQTA